VRNTILILLLLLTAGAVFGQKKSIVNLVSSSSSTGIKRNGKDIIKVYRGTFKQDYSTLTSDSAYFYPQDNAFDAFGHIIINQGDTLNIYSDKLNYMGNTHTAILTDNVRMVDKDATLTTNHLTYNTATRIGTYTDGGKLVNKDNTLVSRTGYYFAYSRDSYFKYNVSLTTPDALVKTDTMRYNTGSKIAYFYGPTNIYSTKGEKKDRDTLYTENGTYNTSTEQANFGKKNLYRSGTKSLKGDSLIYDKLKGYGRAVKHVVFTDNEDKITLRGNLGTYIKAEERTIVTEDPYVIMVSEQTDSTKTDSVRKIDSLEKKAAKQNNHMINMADVIKNTIPAKSDTLRVVPPTMPVKTDTVVNKPPQKNKSVRPDSGLSKKSKPTGNALTTNQAANSKFPGKSAVLTNAAHIKRDSIYMSSDSLETFMITYKGYKEYLEKMRLAHLRDTTSKPKPKVKEKPSKLLVAVHAGVPEDTSYRHSDFFGKPKPKAIVKKVAKPLTKQELVRDSLKRKFMADSISIARKNEPSDTTRIRILIAHHHAKLFKSDLQAKADSMFYSSGDSTIRCYVKPMLWSEGSQLSGDTIFLQMKHKKMDNMTMFPNAFIVNIEKDDSLHFNQLGGKRMRGYFRESKIVRMDIDGNAETIYFSRDSAKKTVDGMQRSISSRMRVNFKDNKPTRLAFYVKPENRYGPLDKFTEDDKILKGFIWKPKDRPVSKESIIPSYDKKRQAAEKAAAGKLKTGKPPLKKGSASKEKAGQDSTVNKLPGKLPALKTGKDSTSKRDTTLQTKPAIKKDSVAVKSQARKEKIAQKQ
jgi:lipopolysaccharide export system protein LptA